MPQETIRILHVYCEEEAPEGEPWLADEDSVPATRHVLPGVCCALLLCLLCLTTSLGSFSLAQAISRPYDRSITQTLLLVLARNARAGELPLFALPPVSARRQATVAATGSIHQDASKATGLITFYNGAFATQAVPAGTSITGKDGITVVTQQTAVIPPATATTPPTYGTVSVTARSTTAGAAGNILASDIDQACCGTSILAQNLYAFSGGHDARDTTVLTQSDISNGGQRLSTQVNDMVNAKARQEVKPGFIPLPLSCTNTFSASQQAGDEASSSLLMLTKTCTPLVYKAVDIEKLVARALRLPPNYRLVAFSAFVAGSSAAAQGGTLTVRVITYLKQIRPAYPYRFAGK